MDTEHQSPLPISPRPPSPSCLCTALSAPAAPVCSLFFLGKPSEAEAEAWQQWQQGQRTTAKGRKECTGLRLAVGLAGVLPLARRQCSFVLFFVFLFFSSAVREGHSATPDSSNERGERTTSAEEEDYAHLGVASAVVCGAWADH
jgi:hypothetical protein